MRTGKCDYKKCKAACCRKLSIILPIEMVGYALPNKKSPFENMENMERWMEGYNVTTETVKILGRKVTKLTFDNDCKYLDLKTFECKNYDKRPDICRLFPWTKMQLEGKPCSFRFEESK